MLLLACAVVLVCLFFVVPVVSPCIYLPRRARLTCVGPPGRLLCYFMNATSVICSDIGARTTGAYPRSAGAQSIRRQAKTDVGSSSLSGHMSCTPLERMNIDVPARSEARYICIQDIEYTVLDDRKPRMSVAQFRRRRRNKLETR